MHNLSPVIALQNYLNCLAVRAPPFHACTAVIRSMSPPCRRRCRANAYFQSMHNNYLHIRVNWECLAAVLCCAKHITRYTLRSSISNYLVFRSPHRWALSGAPCSPMRPIGTRHSISINRHIHKHSAVRLMQNGVGHRGLCVCVVTKGLGRANGVSLMGAVTATVVALSMAHIATVLIW